MNRFAKSGSRRWDMSTHGGYKKYIRSFGWKTLREETVWE